MRPVSLSYTDAARISSREQNMRLLPKNGHSTAMIGYANLALRRYRFAAYFLAAKSHLAALRRTESERLASGAGICPPRIVDTF